MAATTFKVSITERVVAIFFIEVAIPFLIFDPFFNQTIGWVKNLDIGRDKFPLSKREVR